MPTGNKAQTGLQESWSYCVNCRVLFWGPQVGSTNCPGGSYTGAPHNRGTTDYQMMYTVDWAAASNLQPAWAFCTSCKNLVWAPGTNSSRTCMVTNGAHTPGATNYSLFY